MSEHFTKNTLETTKFCNTCNRNTQWHIWNGRLGSCKEEHAKPKPKPEPSKQQDLFEQKAQDN